MERGVAFYLILRAKRKISSGLELPPYRSHIVFEKS
jgi:hypothetical protein